MKASRKIHKFEFDDWGADYPSSDGYGKLVCMDPENMNTYRKYESSEDWGKVTCEHCLKRKFK